MDDKTNAMRLLDGRRLSYMHRSYPCKEAVSGVEAAKLMQLDPAMVYKTLVTVGKSKAHYIFVIPVAAELDLKKAAKCANEKSIAMIPMKELLPLTGYVHGGCSPIGMKKLFPTFVHASAQEQDRIVFSAGKIGHQIEMNPKDLQKIVPFAYADLVE